MRHLRPYFLLLSLSCGLILHVQNASAEESQLTQAQVRESLSPMGEYRFVFRVFFKLYDAALFSSDPTIHDAASLLSGEHAVHLEFDYLREIKKSIVLESSGNILPKNMTDDELASIMERVDQINAAYKTVRKGDESALTYRPGEGTTLWINNEAIVTIPGADFARLYFRIWLGPAPISKTMRDALLKVED